MDETDFFDLVDAIGYTDAINYANFANNAVDVSQYSDYSAFYPVTDFATPSVIEASPVASANDLYTNFGTPVDNTDMFGDLTWHSNAIQNQLSNDLVAGADLNSISDAYQASANAPDTSNFGEITASEAAQLDTLNNSFDSSAALLPNGLKLPTNIPGISNRTVQTLPGNPASSVTQLPAASSGGVTLPSSGINMSAADYIALARAAAGQSTLTPSALSGGSVYTGQLTPAQAAQLNALRQAAAVAPQPSTLSQMLDAAIKKVQDNPILGIGLLAGVVILFSRSNQNGAT